MLRELNENEMEMVSGGIVDPENHPGPTYPGTELWDVNAIPAGGGGDWNDSLQDWGSNAVMTGAGLAGTGLIVTQLDSPLPGPADAVGAGMVIAGGVTAVVGAVGWLIGSIGDLFDGDDNASSGNNNSGS